MNKLVKLALIGVGANAIFAGAFVAFSLMRGAALHEVPLVGKFVDPPAEMDVAEPIETAEADLRPERPWPPRRTSQAGVFDVFRLESPYSNRELTNLVDELSAKHMEADRRLEAIQETEGRLAERRTAVEEQFRTVQQMRTALEEYEAELEARASEVARDEASKEQRGAERWSTLAGLFAEGDVDELGPRLADYGADEAAKILRALPEERARQLLSALPEAQWKTYAEAYSSAAE